MLFIGRGVEQDKMRVFLWEFSFVIIQSKPFVRLDSVVWFIWGIELELLFIYGEQPIKYYSYPFSIHIPRCLMY